MRNVRSAKYKKETWSFTVKQHNTISTSAATLTMTFRNLLRLYSITFFISSASAYGCRVEVNSDRALAKPQYNYQQGFTTYSCTPCGSSTQYEVHVLAVHGAINGRPPYGGSATVRIVSRGLSNRPIVLVLASYEPVTWMLRMNLPTNISISKVILVSKFTHRKLSHLTNFTNFHWFQLDVNVVGMPQMLRYQGFRKSKTSLTLKGAMSPEYCCFKSILCWSHYSVPWLPVHTKCSCRVRRYQTIFITEYLEGPK